jgi:hypothetical protein
LEEPLGTVQKGGKQTHMKVHTQEMPELCKQKEDPPKTSRENIRTRFHTEDQELK